MSEHLIHNMTACDLVLIILMFLCAGLMVWVLILDSRVDDLKGYIKRLEREYNE